MKDQERAIANQTGHAMDAFTVARASLNPIAKVGIGGLFMRMLGRDR